VAARSRLRRSHPQGREAGRPAGAGADQVRDRAQPQDREGARPRHPGHRARARRRGDRIGSSVLRLLTAAIGNIASFRGDAAIRSLSERSGRSASRAYRTRFMSTRSKARQINPKDIFDQASRFAYADKFLRQADLDIDKLILMSKPSMVLSSFASELFLKCILHLDAGHVPPTHDLDTLFRKLPNHRKRRIGCFAFGRAKNRARSI
jgi:hypothetical protein